MNSANDKQEGGVHYQSTYQHWDFVNECLGGQYLEGCLTKYVYRWRKKNGLQDILKAKHYFLKLVELIGPDLDSESFIPASTSKIQQFCSENNLGPLESRVMYLAASFTAREHLDELGELLDKLEAEAVTAHLASR